MQFIDLKAQYTALEKGINTRIQAVLEHGQYIMGPEVGELEKQLSELVGVKHTISCANGTDALQIALMALEIGPGDAVFTTPFTFVATAEAIALVGAVPIFVDVDEATFNIDPVMLEQSIKDTLAAGRHLPRAVIAVDLFGLPADYASLEPLCQKYQLKLVEDAAQSMGSTNGLYKAGSFGDIATTSFFPAKPLGCYGDGGALFTNNSELAEKVRSIRIHGKGRDKYDNIRIGMNSRLDTLQAAILLEKLSVFPDELRLRNRIAERYTHALHNHLATPVIAPGFTSAWAQYTLKTDQRERYIDTLRQAGIPTAIYYPTPLHQATAFAALAYPNGSFPVAETLAQQVFSIPMHPYLDPDTQAQVINKLLTATQG